MLLDVSKFIYSYVNKQLIYYYIKYLFFIRSKSNLNLQINR